MIEKDSPPHAMCTQSNKTNLLQAGHDHTPIVVPMCMDLRGVCAQHARARKKHATHLVLSKHKICLVCAQSAIARIIL